MWMICWSWFLQNTFDTKTKRKRKIIVWKWNKKTQMYLTLMFILRMWTGVQMYTTNEDIRPKTNRKRKFRRISLYRRWWLKITRSHSDLITVNEIVFTVNSHLSWGNESEGENMRWTAWNNMYVDICAHWRLFVLTLFFLFSPRFMK